MADVRVIYLLDRHDALRFLDMPDTLDSWRDLLAHIEYGRDSYVAEVCGKVMFDTALWNTKPLHDKARSRLRELVATLHDMTRRNMRDTMERLHTWPAIDLTEVGTRPTFYQKRVGWITVDITNIIRYFVIQTFRIDLCQGTLEVLGEKIRVKGMTIVMSHHPLDGLSLGAPDEYLPIPIRITPPDYMTIVLTEHDYFLKGYLSSEEGLLHERDQKPS